MTRWIIHRRLTWRHWVIWWYIISLLLHPTIASCIAYLDPTQWGRLWVLRDAYNLDEEFIQGSDSTNFVSMAQVLNNGICYCKSCSKCVHWCRVRSNGSDSKMWSSFENVGKMGTPDFGLSHILTGGNVILCNIKYMISVYYQAFL